MDLSRTSGHRHVRRRPACDNRCPRARGQFLEQHRSRASSAADLPALREIGRGFRSVFRNLPIVWKPVLGFLAFVLLGMLFTVWFRYSWSIVALLCWILLYVAAFILVLRSAVQLSQLKKGGEKLAQGDLDYKTDTRHMFWEFKKHGENLNRISLGMTRAVEEQIKSERLKAELITNVSHDIKTPLTSIINYVDLLQKEDLGNETAQEYVRVLNRQAIQLKKLTEDLVEASKASTGQHRRPPGAHERRGASGTIGRRI